MSFGLIFLMLSRGMKSRELEFGRILSFLRQNPFSYQKKHREIRVYYMSRFPFGIHYLIDGKIIKVFAVFHTSRKPQSWKSRLN